MFFARIKQEKIFTTDTPPSKTSGSRGTHFVTSHANKHADWSPTITANNY